MKSKIVLVFLSIFLVVGSSYGQSEPEPNMNTRTFTSLKNALKNPEIVTRIDLSNQEVQLTDAVLKQFKNIEFLSLKNDNLQEVPHGIMYLKKLKVLDLSGNEIEKLPRFLKKLTNLEEIYLNDEKNLDVDQSIGILTKLPKLKSLHLEGDHLKVIPKRVSKLNFLESLYLTNNDIKELPRNIKLPKNLKLIDLKMNEIGKQIDKENRFGKGLIIEL